jgi:hypothetical protein
VRAGDQWAAGLASSGYIGGQMRMQKSPRIFQESF